MSVLLFAVLAASCAMAVVAVVDLRVPFGPVRRWLGRGRHVVADNTDGPWVVVEWDAETHSWFRHDDIHRSSAAARAHLTGPERARGWLSELVSCPWCAGGWVTLAAVAGVSARYGSDVLWFWPALWWASVVLVLAARRLAE